MATGKVEKVVPESFTMEPSSSITINDQNCIKFGPLIVGTARFTVNTAISSNKMVLSGLPKGKTVLANGYSFCSCTSSVASESLTVMNMTNSANIYSGTSLATGNLMISFCYVAAE